MEAEAKLPQLRKEGRTGVKSRRPEVRPFAGDVRMSYKEMKGELHNYWQMSCNERNRTNLSVELDIWEENIFINERFSGRKKDATTKLLTLPIWNLG